MRSCEKRKYKIDHRLVHVSALKSLQWKSENEIIGQCLLVIGETDFIEEQLEDYRCIFQLGMFLNRR